MGFVSFAGLGEGEELPEGESSLFFMFWKKDFMFSVLEAIIPEMFLVLVAISFSNPFRNVPCSISFSLLVCINFRMGLTLWV